MYVASNSFDNDTEALSEENLRAVVTSCKTEGANYDALTIVTTPTLEGAILDMMSAGRRYMNTDMNFGFARKKVPLFDGIPVISDHHCQSGTVYVLDMSVVEFRVLQEPTYKDLAKTAPTKKGLIETYSNLIVKDVGRCGILTNKS